MKRLFLLLALICSNVVLAETTAVKPQMDQAYAAYKELFPYLLNEEQFQSSGNEEKLKKLIDDLRQSMHSVDSLKEQQKNIPGFEGNLLAIRSLLDDAARRFSSGNKLYALWKLRTVSNNCIGCHTSFNPKGKFIDSDLLERKIASDKAGEFYIATRQYDKAKKLFIFAAKENADELKAMQAVRKWLVVYTRATFSALEGRKAIQEVLSTNKFSEDNKEELERWVAVFSAWEKKPDAGTLADAKSLIGEAKMSGDFMPYHSPVELLRATSILHKILLDIGTPAAHRSEALYLLGYAYNNLRPYFIEETPQLYLEQAIREFPGSLNAKRSYKLIEQILYSDFGGISGSEIPGDELVRLQDLKKIAYNIKDLDGKL